MATIKNAIDIILQAASPRIVTASLPPNFVVEDVNLSTSADAHIDTRVTAATTSIPYINNNPPTNDPVPTGITIATRLNGTCDITLNWTYTQGALPAEGLGIAYREGTGTVLVTDPHVLVSPDSTSYTFFGVSLDGTYRAGIAAYRKSDTGFQVGPIIQPTSSPNWIVNSSTNEFNILVQNIQSANYTLVLSDSAKSIVHPSSDTSDRTWTIPANSDVPFQNGTVVTFVNNHGAGVITITITTDTLRSAVSGAVGSILLYPDDIITIYKSTNTEWLAK